MSDLEREKQLSEAREKEQREILGQINRWEYMQSLLARHARRRGRF